VAARRGPEAEALCRELAAAAPGGPGADAAAVPWADLAEACRAADAVLNGTSVGLPGQDRALPGVAFRPGQVALDMVYGATAFTRDAAEAGATVITGEEMLVRQGAHAFTIWTDRPAPEAVMVAALQRAQEKRPR
jgi:shikimate dehydrogenase